MGLAVDRGLTLEQAKIFIREELIPKRDGAVRDVFKCDARGAMHTYVCAAEDQLMFLSGSQSNQPVMLTCGPTPADPELDAALQLTPHTATECSKVNVAYMKFCKTVNEAFQAALLSLQSATSVQQCDDIYDAFVASL